jgi:hypothetical protein
MANRLFSPKHQRRFGSVRMELLTRWLPMLLRAMSHWREIEARFCELNQESIKKSGRSFRLTA